MAIQRFGDFELDEELRQLRLGGGEVKLQPRAFDLLAYLVNHRCRVVDKDELLEAIWPGVIVTDGSLQRAVSLARAALRTGGLDEAIRTYSGRGYRFTAAPAGPASASPVPLEGALEQARALFRDGSWGEAGAAFEEADHFEQLAAGDLESWGAAMQCAGRAPAAIEPYSRAAAAYAGLNDCEAAARCVLALARIHFETGEAVVARGCLRRAATMLADLPLCEQHGHLAWIEAWLESYAGDLDATLIHARRTVEIGRRLGNADLEAMGLLFEGIALQGSGDAEGGLALQDEAGALVLTGRVTPLLGGIVYCGLISGCCNTGDWPRAGQWSESFTRWCRRNGVRRFSGSCLLHRVEIFIARGELETAMEEIRDSDDVLAMSGPGTIGDARRCLGDIHLLRGELEQAETAYRSAYEHGSVPQPGYALLQHRRGQSAAALRGLRRSIDDTDWAAGERRTLLMAVAAIIAGQSGDFDAAEALVEALDDRPDAWAAGTTRAQVLRAKAELHLGWGEPEEAVPLLREAFRIFQDMDACLEAAVARLRLAEALYRLPDPENAALELDSAESQLERHGALLYLDDCRLMRARTAA